MRDVLKVVRETTLEDADKLLSYFTVQSQKCAFINFLLHLNNLESALLGQLFLPGFEV